MVALDFASSGQALGFADRLDPALCRLKVGKELFTSSGPALVEALIQRGYEVFLDLKFHDIPNTVAQACKAATNMGVWMVNVHASGGRAMMTAAREAVDVSSQRRPLLIAVTLLTSLTDADIAEVGFGGGVVEGVTRLARLSAACGLDGVVCSAQEAPALRHACGTAFKLITPGIRLAGEAAQDQKRVVTPVDAIRLGATYLVMGRSITRAAQPVDVLRTVAQDLEQEAAS